MYFKKIQKKVILVNLNKILIYVFDLMNTLYCNLSLYDQGADLLGRMRI